MEPYHYAGLGQPLVGKDLSNPPFLTPIANPDPGYRNSGGIQGELLATAPPVPLDTPRVAVARVRVRGIPCEARRGYRSPYPLRTLVNPELPNLQGAAYTAEIAASCEVTASVSLRPLSFLFPADWVF